MRRSCRSGIEAMNATKAFMFSALFGLAACANQSQPQPKAQLPDDLADLAKNASIEVVYSSTDGDDVPKVEISSPDPKSARGNALAAIGHGTHFILYSLKPRDYPLTPDSKFKYGTPEYEKEMKGYLEAWYKEKEESCKDGRCLYLNPVLGKIESIDQKDIETLKATLRSALGKVPDFGTACVAEYRHAISFTSDGKHYDILLCYHCGQVGVAVNGKVLEDESQAYDMGKQNDLDAMLTKAGIPLAPKPNW